MALVGRFPRISRSRLVALGPGINRHACFLLFLPSRTGFHFNMLNIHHALTSTGFLDSARQILFHDFADGCRKPPCGSTFVPLWKVSREQPPREPLRIREEERRTFGAGTSSDGAPSTCHKPPRLGPSDRRLLEYSPTKHTENRTH